jgi:hypothetical protein
MIPVLHLILGIVKKLWDNLVSCIHDIECKNCKEISMLMDAHENLACHVSNLIEKKEIAVAELKSAEKQRKDTYKILMDAKMQQPPVSNEEEAKLKRQYMVALQRQKVATELRKQINVKAIDSYSALVKDMASFLKTKQGPIERALEWSICNYPISAKHNPYYGGAFNGNDCMRLLANVLEFSKVYVV